MASGREGHGASRLTHAAAWHLVSAGADLIAGGVLQLQSPQLREAGEELPAPVPNPRQCWPSEGVRRGLYLFNMSLFCRRHGHRRRGSCLFTRGLCYVVCIGLSSDSLLSAGSRLLSLDSSIMGLPAISGEVSGSHSPRNNLGQNLLNILPAQGLSFLTQPGRRDRAWKQIAGRVAA